jgi:rubredoxin
VRWTIGRQSAMVSSSGGWLVNFRKYYCKSCDHLYDEELGAPDAGIAPGTRWSDIPDDWSCPICGASKYAHALVK